MSMTPSKQLAAANFRERWKYIKQLGETPTYFIKQPFRRQIKGRIYSCSGISYRNPKWLPEGYKLKPHESTEVSHHDDATTTKAELRKQQRKWKTPK